MADPTSRMSPLPSRSVRLDTNSTPSPPGGPVRLTVNTYVPESSEFESPPSSAISTDTPEVCPFPFDYVLPYSIKVTGFHNKCFKKKVYRALLAKSNASVVLERSRSRKGAASRAERSFREAEIRHCLKHPNILPFLGIHKMKWHIYIISPSMENQSLVEYLAKNPSADRLEILYDLSGAVRYLHCYQKVIHGNIRASSVSVSLAGSPKLGNFSAAVRERDAQPLGPVDDDEAVRWQSPELHLPKAKPSFKSDVYAFGLTICEALSGDIPFHDILNSADVVVAVARGERPPPRPVNSLATGVPYTPAWTVATTCWVDNPVHRPTITATRNRLRRALLISSTFSATISSETSTGTARTVTPPSRKGAVSEVAHRVTSRVVMVWDRVSGPPPKPSESQTAPSEATTQAPSSAPNLAQMEKRVNFITPGDIESIKSAELVDEGCGDICEGNHRTKGRVTLKRLRGVGNLDRMDEQLGRALKETETWTLFDHPHILRFFGVYRSGNGLYLVSPFIVNGSLMQYLRRNPDADRVRLLMEAASAVAYLHQHGVIHGDIKASNILVSDDVHALLCDFTPKLQAEEATSVDPRGAGTVRWQSPELWTENARKSFQSDVWAFGITTYEVLSGRIPFDGLTDVGAVISAITKGERPPEIPTTSPTGLSYQMVWEVAADCWDMDPSCRPLMQAVHNRLIIAFNAQHRKFEKFVEEPRSLNEAEHANVGVGGVDESRLTAVAQPVAPAEQAPKDDTPHKPTTIHADDQSMPFDAPTSRDIAVELVPPRLVSHRRAPDPPLLPAGPSQYATPTSADGKIFRMKVTDFGFKDGDRRHRMVKTVNLDHPEQPPPPAPRGFLGPKDLVKPIDDLPTPPTPLPFVPGWYRALYPFKAEHEDEMSLTAGKLYEADSRGGNPGDGWVVVSRLVDRRVVFGLAPEAFLQFHQQW